MTHQKQEYTETLTKFVSFIESKLDSPTSKNTDEHHTTNDYKELLEYIKNQVEQEQTNVENDDESCVFVQLSKADGRTRSRGQPKARAKAKSRIGVDGEEREPRDNANAIEGLNEYHTFRKQKMEEMDQKEEFKESSYREKLKIVSQQWKEYKGK
jgi:hypothetical protein